MTHDEWPSAPRRGASLGTRAWGNPVEKAPSPLTIPMATLDDAVGDALTALSKSGVDDPDVDLLRKVTQKVGPSVYSADSRNVACSDPDEKKRVVDGYLTETLGVTDGAASVDAICEKMKGAGSQKHRAAFYYLLTKHHGKESVYAS